MLNGSQVTSEDRRGAELDYLKYNGVEYLNCVQPSNSDLLKEFFTRHPRYQFLVGSKLFRRCILLERKEYANCESRFRVDTTLRQ